MDIYDPGLTAGSTRADGTNTPNDAANKTELDQNVEKLVGNISNWWSGFAKKSQDSITQARKEMENRGGIVNYAKSEYAKLESSIGEAQKKARDQSQQAPEAGPEDKDREDATRSENSKGKQRAVDDQDGEEAGSGSVEKHGPTLGASVSSLFTKLTSDPRLVQLQHSLTSTLQSVSSPTASKGVQDGDAEKAVGATPINIQESLSKLSLTIQSHLPHLDLKESQQLATKYLHATESFAREMQSDMKDFVGELVRIVPPEGEDVKIAAGPDSAKATEKSAISTAVESQSERVSVDSKGLAKKEEATEEEEDFAWDEDDEDAAAASTEAVAAVAPSKDKAADQTPTATVPAIATVEAKAVPSKAEESEDDSDWE